MKEPNNLPEPTKMTSEPYKTVYSVDEWIVDFFDLCGSAGGKEVETLAQIVDEVFYQNHPDDPDAEEKKSRLVAAYNYFVRNLERLLGWRRGRFWKEEGIDIAASGRSALAFILDRPSGSFSRRLRLGNHPENGR